MEGSNSVNKSRKSIFHKLKYRIAGRHLFYLGGPIDSKKVTNYGSDWREQYSTDIVTLGEELGFNFAAYDPSEEEPDMLGYPFEDWGNLKTALRMNNDFATFRKMMSEVMKLDLKRISQSCTVIMRWKNEIPAFGTIHELFYARQIGIPVVLILEDKREELNPWLDCLTADLDIDIFYSWAEFLADLHDKHNRSLWFAFFMRYGQVIRSLTVAWRKLLFRLVDIIGPRPFASFRGRRSSQVYKDVSSQHQPSHPWAIMLIGPPLGGKTTQAEELSRLLNLRHIETSQLIRDALGLLPENLQENEDFRIELYGQKYSLVEEKRKYDAKELNDSNFVFSLIIQALEEAAESHNGVVFSGSPRRVEEAERLVPKLREVLPEAVTRAFEFVITDDVAIARASERQREGDFDTPQNVIKRMRIYEEQTYPVVEWLKKHRVRVIRLDAGKSKAHITRMILHKID
ncbi:MAG: hypothetical protein A3A80_01330 [Candidatus Terrybacteria bacterium RIFCSPLOWO2_01_FULL_44_24]|uniref:Adenylate kinase n=1 Tax=Candidatus Terrybacteria bacterium RIFCSPHIGHO2_01_FULL_43_35 TaxID=1802361 RepID=A0A1G2PH35_9BACT|nr:MAG: hypothetical protein A2828_03705 [Candidatus Terrybacteria bacterium RIFCSPHIGHO2_01_FULL_43_35]OHA49954.1 MAG: hypothetical protein A3B75_03595 [Candidatus Terrybacteria bacterium RIFCSPHIGHO2_02_FULL_43_14]OHA51724.1 MAG: hypothetical protein A3A80_01330 [Candidatus Terrybacteria bacterium RIFCSPLOWO2_01_FULL_44_24]